MATKATIGQTIASLREKQGISRAELGRRAGLSAAFVGQLESGKRPRPSFEVVSQIADALGCAVEEFVVKKRGKNNRICT